MNADANTEGFRILRSDFTLLPLELLWRWTFGLGLLALLFYSYQHLRQAILISGADLAAFDSRDPLAIATSAAGLMEGAKPLLLQTFVRVSALAAVLWVAAIVPGRGILSRIVVRRFSVDYSLPIAPDAPRWGSFAVLTVARVVMLLILVIGYLGGELIAASVSAPGQSLLTPALILFATLALSGIVWSYVNWVLSLAPIFVVRDGLPPLDAVVAALAFIGRNRSHLVAIATWNATLRGIVATLITLAGAFTATLQTALPAWALTLLLALETLAYLVVSDFFLLARFAAYSSVAVRELALHQAAGLASGSTAKVVKR